MTEAHGRAWRLLRQALDRPATERASFLAEACAGDDGLRARVEALLAADARPVPLLDTSLDSLVTRIASAEEASADLTGLRLGPYRLIREIGRGGMGVVYLAERADVGMHVALKLLRGALAAPDHEQRFLQERRLLARLDHPNIARLLDAGIARDGTPWFAMEHVAGADLLTWCDERRLTVRQRLELFEKVAGAVAYAHRNLVVHRDIKPANIRVTAEGEPKLLDFGIAKMLESGDEARTRTGLLLLTPEYAAPEQLRGEAVSTASDVYALGLVLYEMVAGRRAHDHRSGTQAALALAAGGAAAARPSDVVGPSSSGYDAAAADALASARGVDARVLRRQLRGDVDAIVLKAVSPEPDRRYATAAALLADLEAFRRGVPVSAETPTWRYVARRFVQRNAAPVGVATAGVILIVLLTLLYTTRLTDERDRARQESVRAAQVSGFLSELLGAVDPTEPVDRVRTAVDLLDRGLERITTDLADQPDVQAELLELMGDVYVEVGRFEEAERAAREELRIRRDVLADDARAVFDAQEKLAAALFFQGRYRAAAELLEETVARSRADGFEHIGSLALLASVTTRLGDAAKGDGLFREVLAIRGRTLSDTSPDILTVRNNHGHTLLALGRYAEAEQLYRDIFERRVRLRGREQTQTLTTMVNLSRAMLGTGRLDAAEALAREAVAGRRRAFSPGHPRIAEALHVLGEILLARGETEHAHEVLHEARGIFGGAYPAGHPNLAAVLTALGRVETIAGRTDTAVTLLARALEDNARLLGRDHVAFAEALAGDALNRLALGDRAAAEAGLREAERIARSALGDTHPQHAVFLESLADVVARTDRAEARRMLEEAAQIRRTSLGATHPLTARTLSRLVSDGM